MKNLRYDSQLVAGDLNVRSPKYTEVRFTQPVCTHTALSMDVVLQHKMHEAHGLS